MKKLFVMMGLVLVSMITTSVFADDMSTTQDQMNNQMPMSGPSSTDVLPSDGNSMPVDNGTSMPTDNGMLNDGSSMTQDPNAPPYTPPTDSSVPGQNSSDMGTSSRY